LAIDLGTSAVKAIVWRPDQGLLARASAPVRTSHPQPGWDEQDADSWLAGVQQALDAVPLDGIGGVGLSSQRETFVCLDDDARPLRPGILWSDGRAPSPRERWEWLQDHEPTVAVATRWLAAPKDYVLHRMVGRLVTDSTLVSRTNVDPALLPTAVPPRTVIGEFREAAVFAGAGDRACEALAVGATADSPMVSWGTTANCTIPLTDVPPGWRASLGVDGGTLAEAGLSAASALGWLSERLAIPTTELQGLAARSPAGANGVIALPWLNGARAPWWRPDARLTVCNETAATGPGDLARALYEGVAHDLRRALAQLPAAPRALRLAGGGAHDACWQQVLSGITGLPLTVYGADMAAIGAAQLTMAADAHVELSPEARVDPEPTLVAQYAELAQAHDAAAATALGSSA
jgi:xylulokinase